jgi:hypothetical protein
MAIYYNLDDKCYYGTDAERLAADITKFPETSKFYAYNTKKIWLVVGGAWVEM